MDHKITRVSAHRKLYNEDKNYDVIYLDEGDLNREVCERNGSVITLEHGVRSAVIIRLGNRGYHYRPFNCSIQISAGASLDGLTAVVEEMDLREHEDDRRQPGGHWGSSVCLDYVEAFTEKTKVRSKLCGEWSVLRDERLNSHGPRQTLVGYCYDDHSGHSCESKSVFVNAIIDSRRELSNRYGLNLRSRQGFSIVVTGYRHPRSGSCDAGSEFTCLSDDFSLHAERPHCISKDLKCDSHQNCGFTHNEDESGCVVPTLSPWSASTLTMLVVIYLAIVLILVVVTMLLLRWNKSLRIPLDVDPSDEIHALESRSSTMHGLLGVANGGRSHEMPISFPRGGGVTSSDSRAGTVSIMVMYRPQKPPGATGAKPEPPPSYDSIFMGDVPPDYHLVRVHVPPSEGQQLPDEPDLDLGEGGATTLSSPDTPAQSIENNNLESVTIERSESCDEASPLTVSSGIDEEPHAQHATSTRKIADT